MLSWDGEDILLHNADGSFRARFSGDYVSVSILNVCDHPYVRGCCCGHCDWCLAGKFYFERKNKK